MMAMGEVKVSELRDGEGGVRLKKSGLCGGWLGGGEGVRRE